MEIPRFSVCSRIVALKSESHYFVLAFGLSVPFFAKKTALERKWIHNVQLFEQNYTSCWFFTLFNSKPTVFKAEQVVPLTTQQRDYSDLCVFDPSFLLIVFKAASVEKRILLAGVAVQIAIKHNFPLRMHMSNKLFRMENGWVKQTIWFLPFPVEVASE